MNSCSSFQGHRAVYKAEFISPFRKQHLPPQPTGRDQVPSHTGSGTYSPCRGTLPPPKASGKAGGDLGPLQAMCPKALLPSLVPGHSVLLKKQQQEQLSEQGGQLRRQSCPSLSKSHSHQELPASWGQVPYSSLRDLWAGYSHPPQNQPMGAHCYEREPCETIWTHSLMSSS